MQIIIPMSGFGERFRRAGYNLPKPLIMVDKKPIIAHVIDMFPGEKNFIFICNKQHLSKKSYKMAETIKKYCPTGKILGISPHNLGPVHAVLQAIHLIDFSQPTIVNYCDFSCYWNWDDFKKFILETNCAGAIPAYKGFHPHSLGSTNYAYLQERNGKVLDVKEKESFTSNRMNEFASSGTYYFSNAANMIKIFKMAIKKNLSVKGEFYVSLTYKILIENDQYIAVYPLQHFMQWGTPEDLLEYNYWSGIFKNLIKKTKKRSHPKGTVIIPMAGLGKRFLDKNYKKTKPLIPVSGKPMSIQAINDLPKAEKYIFVLRKNDEYFTTIKRELINNYPKSLIKKIDGLTKGQACTAYIGFEEFKSKKNKIPHPITIGACDNGVIYNYSLFKKLVGNQNIDIIVWVVRGHPNAARFPNMFGWAEDKKGIIKNILVKKPSKNPKTDPMIIGTFTFKEAKLFEQAYNHLLSKNSTVNGEFYIDSCINSAIELGMKCQIFEVDYYLGWGTPNDLETFNYWQSCFHKWSGHPYRVELDSHVQKKSLPKLLKQISQFDLKRN